MNYEKENPNFFSSPLLQFNLSISFPPFFQLSLQTDTLPGDTFSHGTCGGSMNSVLDSYSAELLLCSDLLHSSSSSLDLRLIKEKGGHSWLALDKLLSKTTF